jgi:NAD+ diphosphatase
LVVSMTPAANTPAPRPFTGVTLDRVSDERKDLEWVSAQLVRPDTRAVAAGREGVLVSEDEPGGMLRVAVPQQRPGESVLLGLEDGRALFALDLDAGDGDPDGGIAGGRVISLREAGVLLTHREAGLAAYVTAMLNWHRRNRFCANCGHATDSVEGGYSRHCPACGTTHFPRTDPVVIMTVEHEGRLLLGRRTGWPEGRLSVLAGFVSPGESAEEAVVREVWEESGIIARDPVFVASQPWPFPASLMLGFHAESDGGEPHAIDGELAEVHWLDLDKVRRATLGKASVALPGPVSIARFLIERWVAGKSG